MKVLGTHRTLIVSRARLQCIVLVAALPLSLTLAGCSLRMWLTWTPEAPGWSRGWMATIALLAIWSVAWIALFPGFNAFLDARRGLSRSAASWLVVSLAVAWLVGITATLEWAHQVSSIDEWSIDWLNFPLFLAAIQFVLAWACLLLGIITRAGAVATGVSVIIALAAYAMPVTIWFWVVASV